jgi:protein-disulfide isomerase
MHDIIFENQDDLHAGSLKEYARQIGLDLKKFEKDIVDEGIIAKVEADFESGIRSGVNGTPGLFVNGHKYNDDWESEDFVDYIRSQIDLAVK